MSLGQDTGRSGVPGARRDHPGRRAAAHRGTRDHDARARPHRRPVLDHERSRGPQGGAGARREEGRLRQDLGRRSRRQVQEADAGALWRRHRRGPQAQAPRHRPHLCARGREGAAAGGPRRLCSRRARQGHRRRVRRADEGSARTSSLVPNLPDRGVATDLELAERDRSRRGVEETAGGGHGSAGRATGVRHSGAQPREAQCRGRPDRPRHRRQRRLELITSRWPTWWRRE